MDLLLNCFIFICAKVFNSISSCLPSFLFLLLSLFDACNSECASMLAALPPLQPAFASLSGSVQLSPDPLQTPLSSRALDAENSRVIAAALRRFLKRHLVLGASEILRLLQPKSAQMLTWPPDSRSSSPSHSNPSKCSKRAPPSSVSPAPLAVAQTAGPSIDIERPPERTADGRATRSNNGVCPLSLVLCDRASLSARGALSPLLPPLLQLSTLRQVPIVPVPQLELHLPRALCSTHCSFLGFKVFAIYICYSSLKIFCIFNLIMP